MTNKQPIKAVLLAAGFGQRFKPYSEILPKPAIPFLNIPLLFFPVNLLENEFSIKEMIVNTHHLPEKISDLITTHSWNFKFHISIEKRQILGTGGALYPIISFLKDEENFVLCNADALILPHKKMALNLLLDEHKKRNALATLLVMNHPDILKKYSGVWLNNDHMVLGIGKENKYQNASPFHFTGIQIISNRIFNYIKKGPSDIFRDILLPASKQGENLYGFPMDLTWFEMGNLEDYLMATKQCLTSLVYKNKSSHLTNTLERFSPGYQDRLLKKNGLALIGKFCHIHKSLKIEQFAIIGDGVTINENVILNQSVINNGLSISQNQTLFRELRLSS